MSTSAPAWDAPIEHDREQLIGAHSSDRVDTLAIQAELIEPQAADAPALHSQREVGYCSA